MYLFVDPTGEKIEAYLLDDRFSDLSRLSWQDDQNQSQEFLANIKKLLRKKSANLGNIKAIFLIPGPGSYTTLRVIISSLNTLAYAKNIPIISVSSKEASLLKKSLNNNSIFRAPVLPKYLYPAKITQKKSRQ